jgi:2'-5' RNA ligase
MSRKAVDVVLLPVNAVTNKAIELNAELVEMFGRKIVLDEKSCLPHISLAMGCVDERDIAPVGIILQSIAKDNSLGDLKISGIKSSRNSAGENVSVLEVEKTDALQSLHKEVMKKMSPYFSYDVTADMIYDNEEVAETTLQWIKNYREKSSFEKFFPHITIGYGELDRSSYSAEFAVSRLALCHLGNHCTCRKILASAEL